MANENLKFDITARDRTAQAFHRVKGQVDGLQRSFNGLKVAMGAAFSAASILGVSRLSDTVRGAVEEMDRLAKAADKIGVTTSAFQELQHAAELSGVSTRAFELGLQRFSRRVAEAAQGAGELKDTLQQYGIQLRTSDGRMRSVTAILMDYADAVANAESEQEQLRMAFKAFDSEGAAMVNMLKDGSDALNNLREDARRLGLVYDEGLLRRAEELNDQLATMDRIISVNLNQSLLSLGPTLTWASEEFAKWAEGVNMLVDAFRDFEEMTDRGRQRAIAAAEARLQEATTGYEKAKQVLEQMREANPVFVSPHQIRQQEQAVAELRAQMEAAREEVLRLHAQMNAVNNRPAPSSPSRPEKPAAVPGTPVRKPKPEFESAFPHSADMDAVLFRRRQRELFGDASEGLEYMRKSMAALQREADAMWQSMLTPEEQFLQDMEKIDSFVRASLPGWTYESEKYYRAVTAASERYNQAMATANDNMHELEKAAGDTGGRLGTAFEDAVARTATLPGVFERGIRALIREVVQ